jgi:ssDNA-specific exonuclease RecJ
MKRRNLATHRQERYKKRMEKKIAEHISSVKPIPLDEIKFVLSKHHWECVFELDAPQKIYDRLKIRSRAYWMSVGNLDEFRNCFIQSEIYCPHENVDRRSEYGINVG